MGSGGARLGPGPDSGFTKGSLQGSYGGYGRGQVSKHSSASSSSSRLGNKHQHHKQALAQSSYSHSPQNSFTSGSYQSSANSSGPPSRRFPSGESSSHSSPAGVLQFQQRQHQQHSPHQHSPDHQHLSGSPLHRSGKAADVGRVPSDGLLPSPHMDMRVPPLIGGGGGYIGAGSNPNGRGLPMVAGLGQQQFLGVGVPWPAHHNPFHPAQIYATDHLLVGEYQVSRLLGISQVF